MNNRTFHRLFKSHVLALVLCLPLSATAAIHEITVGDNFFSTAELTIQVGDTVRWINPGGGNLHDVTSSTGAWAPSQTSSSFTFEVTFNSPGTFPYFCTVHPVQMQGTIIVEGGATAEVAVSDFVTMKGTFSAGSPITLDTQIQNTGDAASGALDLDYFVVPVSESVLQGITTASDAGGKTKIRAIPEGSTLLGTANVANVNAGQTVDHQAVVEVPDTIAPGQYLVGVNVDFADANASNNEFIDPGSVNMLGQFQINAGLNDAWVSADAAFQGFFFTVFPDLKLFFASWFTFDSVAPGNTAVAEFGAADQRWVTASGFYSGDSVTLNVELTSGGIFNGSEPLASQTPNYGTITIKFITCNEASVTYDFPALNLSGAMTLTRVVGDNVALCEILNAEAQASP